MNLDRLLRTECARERTAFRRAGLLAALVGGASVALLGLSGWFITAAAFAALAGPIAAQGFNYLLPSAGIRLLAIARTGARYGERLTSHAAALRTMARVRGHLFLGLARSPAGLRIGAGEASARMVQDVAAIEGGLVRRSTIAGLAASVISGCSLAALGGEMAVVATLACLAALLGLALRIGARADRLAREVQVGAGRLKQEFAELAGALPELRCYALEDWAADRIAERGHSFGEAQRRLTAIAGLYEAAQAAALALAATLALALAAPAGAPIAALAALAAAMTIDGAAPFVRDIAARGSVRAAEDRLSRLLASEDDQPAMPVASPRLRLSRGFRLGLVGPSGCGKTTLVERLIGQRPLPRGLAMAEGRDLALLPARHTLFAWCPQDAMLLTGTVRDNLRLAAPQADEAALWSALHDAALDERIRALGGLDIWIGEDGVRLSGGERRRLALARALLADAPLLLLDEPTEGLDAATEALVVDRLLSRLTSTGQGLLLVSHRSAPLALCDEIIRLGAAEPADLAA